jgi:tetratricopeptide (TPR) repeat protein
MFREMSDTRGICITLLNLGICCKNLGDLSSAALFQESVLPLSRELGDVHTETLALSNLGGVYQLLGEHARAIECHTSSVELARRTANRPSEAIALFNRGAAYYTANQRSRAVSDIRMAYEMFTELGDLQNASKAGGILAYLNEPPDGVFPITPPEIW